MEMSYALPDKSLFNMKQAMKIIPMWKKQMYHDKSCQDELGPP
jgi:hypothetical protein